MNGKGGPHGGKRSFQKFVNPWEKPNNQYHNFLIGRLKRYRVLSRGGETSRSKSNARVVFPHGFATASHETVAFYHYLGSTGKLAFTHSFQPPLRAYTFVYPFAINCRATQALVASLCQEQ